MRINGDSLSNAIQLNEALSSLELTINGISCILRFCFRWIFYLPSHPFTGFEHQNKQVKVTQLTSKQESMQIVIRDAFRGPFHALKSKEIKRKQIKNQNEIETLEEFSMV